MVKYKHSKTKQRIKKNKRRRKTRKQKRRHLRGGDANPIKNIFYIWLGETAKCGLTETNLKSWREGFPEAKITILVIKEKIHEFHAHFSFIDSYGVHLLSPYEFLSPLMKNIPVQKTIALLDRYLPFLLDGERSLYNESFAYVSGEKNPSAYELVLSSNDYFQRVHTNYLNTSSKIAARLKDLLCFIGCMYNAKTLYLDIDTTYDDFNVEEMPSTTKLYLPIIENTYGHFQTDLFAVLSFDKIDIDEAIINNYIKVFADYLDAVPYYYLAFTTDSTLLDKGPSNKGIEYMKDQFNICSTIILVFAHFLFIQHTKPIFSKPSDPIDFSKELMLINENMMMYPNIMLLDPRMPYCYEASKPEIRSRQMMEPFMFSRQPDYLAFSREYEDSCRLMTQNIEEEIPILKDYDTQLTFSSEPRTMRIYLNKKQFTNNDYYAEVVSIYEFRKCINNDFLNRILKNIQGESAPQITRPLQKNGKEDLISLQKWICQILDKEYEYGFKKLYQMSRESHMTRKEALMFPALSVCDLIVSESERGYGRILCRRGLLEFYKQFNKSYFA